jgi:hypothetical protein
VFKGQKCGWKPIFVCISPRKRRNTVCVSAKKKAICLLTKYKSRTKLGVKRYFSTSKMLTVSSSNPQIYHKLRIIWRKSSVVLEKVAPLQRFREVKSSNLVPETSHAESFCVLSVPTSQCQIITVSLHVISDSLITDHPTIPSTDSVHK